MSNVSIQNLRVLNNPTFFEDDFEFEIEFNCVEKIEGKLKNKFLKISDDLEWKLVYVGSGSDPKYDQELDSILVGPVEAGINKFIFKVKFFFFNSRHLDHL
jgi:histone chaperone ASF1